ncbi:MAG: hypothetical protein K6B38_08310 [Ruminococcus sp.]|nr:hypothetical protein [Ruminococcus sp.]
MTEAREYTRSTSPENFEKLYSQLSDSEKALISAYMDVTFALLKNMQDMMKHKEARP